MASRARKILLWAASLAIVVAAWWLLVPSGENKATPSAVQTLREAVATATPIPEASPTPAIVSPELEKQADDFFRLIAAGGPLENVLAAFTKLRELVHALPPEVAAETLIALLRSGRDAATGLPFAVGEEGVLDSAPTFRTSLMDLLGQTTPDQAAAYSWEILAHTSSSDEYPLALRNIAWARTAPGWTPAMQQAFAKMLQNPVWMREPSGGFLEGFDFAVDQGKPGILQMAGVLADAKAAGNDAVGRAAFIALDRLMLRDPGAVVQVLRENPSMLSSAPDELASLASRLDVRDPAQRAYLEDYLAHQSPGSPTTAYFFSVFPNGNRFDAPRLVTTSEPTVEAMSEIDRATLQAVLAWRRDPRFSQHSAALAEVELRLRGFVGSVR